MVSTVLYGIDMPCIVLWSAIEWLMKLYSWNDWRSDERLLIFPLMKQCIINIFGLNCYGLLIKEMSYNIMYQVINERWYLIERWQMFQVSGVNQVCNVFYNNSRFWSSVYWCTTNIDINIDSDALTGIILWCDGTYLYIYVWRLILKYCWVEWWKCIKIEVYW